MENILGVLHYPFIVNALLAVFLISIVSGIVGTLVVVRRMVFVTGGITHASFGGIGIAYYLGLPPVGGAMLFAVATALSVEWLGQLRPGRPPGGSGRGSDGVRTPGKAGGAVRLSAA